MRVEQGKLEIFASKVGTKNCYCFWEEKIPDTVWNI